MTTRTERNGTCCVCCKRIAFAKILGDFHPEDEEMLKQALIELVMRTPHTMHFTKIESIMEEVIAYLQEKYGG